MAYSMGSLVTLGAVRQLYLYIATGRSNGPDACKVLSCLKALILIGPPLTGSPLAFYFARFPGTNWVLEALTQDSEILKVTFCSLQQPHVFVGIWYSRPTVQKWTSTK